MLTRTDSLTLTVPRERFAFSGSARSTEPEVFTFERIPAQATAVRSYVPIRPKKRCTRVMYPAKVRMHLPPPEQNRAKRWLVVLCLVVLWQIYTEEPCADSPPSGADAPASEFQGFPFQSPEELAQLGRGAEPFCGLDAGGSGPEPGHGPEQSRPLEKSGAGNSYVVALLVYHRLGGDN